MSTPVSPPTAPVQRLLGSSPGIWLVEHVLLHPAQRRWHDSLRRPGVYQQRILADLLRQGRRTSFGGEHGFDRITNVEEYQRRVPVRDYPGLRPWVDRMLYARERDVLWPDRVDWFAESSGTSGPKKQIPITRAGLGRVYVATAQNYIATLIARLNRSVFLAGKSIFFVGKLRTAEHDPTVLLGDVTALNVHLTPWYLDFVRAPAKHIAINPNINWEERLHNIAQATLDENIVHLAGLPTWLTHFSRRVLELSGQPNLRAVWPNLLAVTVGGVSPQPYLPDLHRLIAGDPGDGPPLLASEVYNGTEGFFAMQHDSGDMTWIADGGIFYEFIPRTDAEAGRYATAVTLDGIREGEDYAPVISSYNGLWRYLIGDTVRFTALTPYRVQVTGRIHQSLSLAGEELLLQNTDAALGQVCAGLGVGLVDYTATALKLNDTRENAFHLWLVELAEPAAVTGPEMAAVLDRQLLASHYDYTKMRAAGAFSHVGLGLSAPLVVLLPRGSFLHWLNYRLQGQTGGQSKIPRLSSDPDLASEILAALSADALAQALDPYPALQRDQVLALVSGRQTANRPVPAA
jgi:hypothetical protein